MSRHTNNCEQEKSQAARITTCHLAAEDRSTIPSETQKFRLSPRLLHVCGSWLATCSCQIYPCRPRRPPCTCRLYARDKDLPSRSRRYLLITKSPSQYFFLCEEPVIHNKAPHPHFESALAQVKGSLCLSMDGCKLFTRIRRFPDYHETFSYDVTPSRTGCMWRN